MGDTEEDIRGWHAQFDLDESALVAVKLLQQQLLAETRSCILRYTDEEASENAIKVLRRQKVITSTGQLKHLHAKAAAPASWMVEKGLADAPPERPKDWRYAEKVATMKSVLEVCGPTDSSGD